MKLIAVSDLHLDQATSGIDRFDDVSKVLTSAVDHAVESSADAFLFLGDLADPNTVRAHRSVDALGAAMFTLKSHGIPTVCLAGNHDVIEDGSGNTVLDALRWIDAGPVFTRPSVHTLERPAKLRNGSGKKFVCTIVALPFTPLVHNYDPEQFIRELPELTSPVVVIGHLNLKGITLGSESTDMPRGRDVFWPLEALHEKLPEALWLGGHYHTPQTFEGVRIIGSAVRLRFDERDNAPGFVSVEF